MKMLDKIFIGTHLLVLLAFIVLGDPIEMILLFVILALVNTICYSVGRSNGFFKNIDDNLEVLRTTFIAIILVLKARMKRKTIG